jgi:transposase
MYEGRTLVGMVEELRTEHEIGNVMLVAGRAMFTKRNLDAMDAMGVKYIVAAKLKTLSKAVRERILSEAGEPLLVSGEPHRVSELEIEGRRLVVSYNELRAKKDEADRRRLVERLLKRVKNGRLSVSDLISNAGTKRYVKVSGDMVVSVNEEKIAVDARWDGLHGIITNATGLSPDELLDRYHGLWRIEEAFRVSKHDLKMRPIFHWTPERIRAHVSMCFLALALARQAVYRYSVQQMPISFEQMRNELLHAQVSVVRDLTTSKYYAIPSQVTLNQEKIYQVFGLRRTAIPYSIVK